MLPRARLVQAAQTVVGSCFLERGWFMLPRLERLNFWYERELAFFRQS